MEITTNKSKNTNPVFLFCFIWAGKSNLKVKGVIQKITLLVCFFAALWQNSPYLHSAKVHFYGYTVCYVLTGITKEVFKVLASYWRICYRNVVETDWNNLRFKKKIQLSVSLIITKGMWELYMPLKSHKLSFSFKALHLTNFTPTSFSYTSPYSMQVDKMLLINLYFSSHSKASK